MSYRFFYILCLFTLLLISCATPYGDGSLKRKGRPNYFLKLVNPITPSRISQAYDNSVVNSHRVKSDCQPFCPVIDAWQYQYKGKNGKIIIDKKPISTRKEFWKNKNEARIISITLYGSNPIYIDGLITYLDSFKYLNDANKIEEPLWGYENFTVRLYTPKRNPKDPLKLGALKGEIPEKYVNDMLDRGLEVVYVDNQRNTVGVDAFFWRFLVMADKMPPGQKLRYLIRDADQKLTGGEAYAVGEWIDSGFKYSRLNLNNACMTPVTGSLFEGVIVGGEENVFKNILQQMEEFPYRLDYGDDELFIRDRIWPYMKYSGSVLTHYNFSGWKSWVGNPYVGSCEQPTQKYCDTIKLGGECKDVTLPEDVIYPIIPLGLRYSWEYFKEHPEFFEMHLNTERGQRVKKALSIYGE
ncbi:MAG: hypothetical protein O2897_01410 [bacterium]|nr:hypothetical protein [bacterium]